MKSTAALLFCVAMVVPAIVKSQDSVFSSSLASLVNTERSFATTCGEKGIRQSFLDFLADSSILFRPHPVNGKKFLLSRPAPVTLPQVLLAWTPIFGEVSGSGDLGYTTGPYEFSDLSPKKEPTQHGAFFSVWKKQADGTWKVVLDVGIQTPVSTAPLSSHFAPPPTMNRERPNDPGRNGDSGRKSLIEVEQKFSSLCAQKGILEGYDSYLCRCARMHRSGELPIIGRDSVEGYLKNHFQPRRWKPIASDVAESGDLGFVYGRYESHSSEVTSEVAREGYYVRVWRKNTQNRWVIVFDTEQPLPRDAR